ncbi:Ras GTPase [Planoprotostelium fungivorum]|uniref:Ras GTPase n=1 Tax=Planoprotostelium fungivorum TaxID=1890364 RepID=A0A2P6NDS2_9EUKA|nr:Ras GTPase [Planoprotostelium fungivorum]
MPTPQVSRKICVMGFRAVGKSTITIQFVENHFADQYNPTIENTFHKTIRYKNTDYITEIVDTAGQDEYSIFQKHYSVGVHGYILVYSVTSRKSLDMIKSINDKILNALGADKVPRVIVGNKTDLFSERKVTTEEGQKLAKDWGCGFVECSGKHNEYIGDIFNMMVMEIEKESSPPSEANKEDAISTEVAGDIDAPNALLRGLKKPLLIRELPQPSTPKVSRQGTAPVPQSPSVAKEKVLALMESGAARASSSFMASREEILKDKVTRLENEVRLLEKKLNDTLITHHGQSIFTSHRLTGVDQAELQNKVIVRLLNSRKRTKKKLKEMNQQIKAMREGEHGNSSDDSNTNSMSSFATMNSFGRGLGGSMRGFASSQQTMQSEIIRSLNDSLDKQKEQREIDALTERLYKTEKEARKTVDAISQINEQIYYLSVAHEQGGQSAQPSPVVNSGPPSLLIPPPMSRETHSGPPSGGTSPGDVRVMGLSLYEYGGHRSGDLSFEANEIIFILKKYSDGWWLGKSHNTGNLGRFPSNYIEELPANPKQVVATEDSKDEQSGDLTFKAGDIIFLLRESDEDNGWAFGELQGAARVKGCDETIATVHLDATASVGIDWLFKLKPSATPTSKRCTIYFVKPICADEQHLDLHLQTDISEYYSVAGNTRTSISGGSSA